MINSSVSVIQSCSNLWVNWICYLYWSLHAIFAQRISRPPSTPCLWQQPTLDHWLEAKSAIWSCIRWESIQQIFRNSGCSLHSQVSSWSSHCLGSMWLWSQKRKKRLKNHMLISLNNKDCWITMIYEEIYER